MTEWFIQSPCLLKLVLRIFLHHLASYRFLCTKKGVNASDKVFAGKIHDVGISNAQLTLLREKWVGLKRVQG